MPKQANKADKERMNAIAQMPCIVCLLYFNAETPAGVHHLVEAGRRLGHQFTIPLCHPHHGAEIRSAVLVSRHPYKAEFERRYGTEAFLLEETNKLIKVYS